MKSLKRIMTFVTCSICFVTSFLNVSAETEMNVVAANIGNNVLIYSIELNQDGENSPSYLASNEHEPLGPDTFFVSDNMLFIDDTINCRIMVYENGTYAFSIPLSWNRNVEQLYYDSDSDILKIIYKDREEVDCTHLYIVEYDVSEISQLGDPIEISDSDNILLGYCFDSGGN